MQAVRKIAKLFTVLPLLGRNVAIVSLLVCSILVFLESLVRKLVGVSIIITTELGNITMICLVGLSLGWIYEQKGHLRVTVAVDRLSARYLRILEFAQSILSACFVSYALFLWAKMALRVYQSKRFLVLSGMPEWPVMFAGVLAWFLLLIPILKEIVEVSRLGLGKRGR